MLSDALQANWVTVTLAALNVMQTLTLAGIAARSHRRRIK
jgi:hypothetical protein